MSGVTNQEEDKKPTDQARIILKVERFVPASGSGSNQSQSQQDGNVVFFRMKRNTQLKKLMYAYCDRQSVELDSFAFMFDGRRLRGEQTPDELEMEDGDEILAMPRMGGPSTAY